MTSTRRWGSLVALLIAAAMITMITPAQAAGAAPAAVAAAAPTTTTNNQTLSGASAEQFRGGLFTHCDGCAPDDLFSCGGCEITAGAKARLFTRARWTAPLKVETTGDPDGLHQGSTTDVTSKLTPGAGTISIDYRIPYEIGIFGKGGNFPADWTSTQEYTHIGTFNASTSAACTPRLAGDGNGTCTVSDSINVVPETCFFVACAVDVTVDLVINHTFTVGPAGIVAHRSTTFSPNKDITYDGATPASETETISTPCSATVGDFVRYDLGGFDYTPAVSVDGGAGLHIIIDGPGPANADPTVSLLDGVNVFNGSIPMTDGFAPSVLGRVLVDNQPPKLGEVTTTGPLTEGSPVGFTVGAVDNCPGNLTFRWTFSDGGTAEGRNVQHTFTDSGVHTGTVSVSDAAGNTTATPLGFSVTIENAPPAVTIDPDQVTEIVEGGTVAVDATFTDGGDDDPYTATIDYGDGSGPQPATMTPGGAHAGAVGGSFQYGDNGTYRVTVAVTDEEGATGTAGFDVTVGNVDPDASIGNDDPVMADVGQPTTFDGSVTDPGSDDITSTWSWADGTADDVQESLVNPPADDPAKSPSVQPREVSHDATHAFTDACAYTVGFSAADDDGGTDSESRLVIITAAPTSSQGAGYWQKQYGRQGAQTFTDAQVECYLDIVGSLSDVFHEVRSAATIAEAFDGIYVAGLRGSMTQQLDRQLLTAWTNFANGGVEYDELLDTNRDGVGDTPFHEVMEAAESVRLDPAATRTQLQAQRDLLVRINERDAR